MHLRRWLAALVMVALTVGMVGQAASAAEEKITVEEAVRFLQQFGIVQGDERGLRLGDPITRAEMIKILVVATGHEREAAILKGAAVFKDVMDHWASGHIAVAKNLGLAGGYPDGSFKPDNQVTNAEVIAFLTRAAGVKADASQQWPQNVLLPAVAASIIPQGLDLGTVADSAATRGGVFLLGHRSFKIVKDDQGKNLYQRVQDTQPPVLEVTADRTTTSDPAVTLRGTVRDAVSLTVAGNPVTVGAAGAFTVAVDLALGTNAIEVAATDEVGNVARKVISVARSAGEPAKIEAPGAVSLKAGEASTLKITVRDANGLAIPDAKLTGEVSGDVGEFDAGELTLSAAQKPGSGQLVLKAGSVTARVSVTVVPGAIATVKASVDKPTVAVGEQARVSAKAYDQFGNEVTGLPVLFNLMGSGALINPSTGVVIGSAEGLYTVTATIGTVTGSTEFGVYGEMTDVKITGPKEAVGNKKGIAFQAAAVDRFGNTVRTATKTINLTSSVGELVDADGRALTSVTLKDGVGTFYVQADDLDWGVVGKVTATDQDDTDMTDEYSFEVSEQKAAAIKVVFQDEYLAANASDGDALVKLAVVDQAGVEMLSGAWDVDWTISGPAREKSSDERSGTLTYSGGTPYEFELESRAGETGEVTVTFAGDGLTTGTARLQAKVVGDAKKVVVTVDRSTQRASDDPGVDEGKPVIFNVSVTDSNGVPVKHTGTIHVDFSDNYSDAEDDDGDIVEVDSNGDGDNDRISITFDQERRKSFRVAFAKSGDYTATAKPDGGTLTSGTATFTIQAGSADNAGFLVKGSLLGVTNPSGQATVQVFDELGNAVPQAGVRVKVRGNDEHMTINGSKQETTVTTDEKGQAVLKYAVRPDTAFNFTITVQAAGSGVDVGPAGDGKGTLAVNVKATVATRIEVKFDVDEGGGFVEKTSGKAGSDVNIKVYVYDRYDALLSDYEDILTLKLEDNYWSDDDDTYGDPATIVEESINWSFDGTDKFYHASVIPAKTGRTRVNVSIDVAGTTVAASNSFRINTNTADHVIISEADFGNDPPTIHVKKGEIKKFTLRMTDEWHNPVTAPQTKNVRFDSGTGAIFRTEATGADIGGSGVSLTSSTSLYVLLPSSGTDGLVTIRENNSNGDAMNDWVFQLMIIE